MSYAPQVSVLMPSLNQCDFIEVAVRSVLEQREAAVELLISDGGSTDGTLGLLEKLMIEFCPRLRWVSAADSGPANAINRAFHSSRGDIIGWLNADDIYAEDAVAAAVRLLAADAELVMVYGEAHHVDASGRMLHRYPTRPPSVGIEAFQSGCFICQPTVFMRRCIFEQLGGLDEELSTAFDFDLWLRVFRCFSGRIGHMDRVQAYSRLHGRTITSLQRKAVASEAVRLLSRYLGCADPHWILTYIEESTRTYPSYGTSIDLRGHVSEMITELASCFDEATLSRFVSLLNLDRRLAVPAGVHAEIFPDGWAGRELSLRVRAPFRGSLSLLLQCEHSRPGVSAPLGLRIKTNCGTEASLSIKQPGPFEIVIVFPEVTPGQLLFATVSSSSIFIPIIAEHGSTDARELAFRITRIFVEQLEFEEGAIRSH
jgi:glycosyltransferase involved in cell wall biosynthesis